MTAREVSVVGVGDGGCRIVHALSELVRESPSLAAVNTDTRSLECTRATTKVQIGRSHTDGLGAGGHVSLGRLAAEDDMAVLQGLFAGTKLALVVVGLGGGTGTGAAPVLLRAAREAGAMTFCFATLPFTFEGEQRRQLAEEAVDEIREVSDALVAIPNDRLFHTGEDVPVADAFARADRVVAGGLCSVWKLLTDPGYINLDFNDIKRVAQGSGRACSFGYAEAGGEDRVARAVEQLLQSSLLAHGQHVANAGAILVSIVGGPDLTLREVGDIMGALQSKVAKDCRLEMGTVIDDDWKGKVTVSLIVSEEAPPPDILEVAAVPLPGMPGAEPPTAKRTGKKKQRQTSLSFGATGKGRFKDVEPTIMDGEDLDIPTFVRRGVRLPK